MQQILAVVELAVYPDTELQIQQVQLESGQAPEREASQQNEALPQADANQQANPLPHLDFVSQRLPEDTVSEAPGADNNKPLSTIPTPASPLASVTAATLMQWDLAAFVAFSLEVIVATTRRPFLRGCMLILAGPLLLGTCALALVKLPSSKASSDAQSGKRQGHLWQLP